MFTWCRICHSFTNTYNLSSHFPLCVCVCVWFIYYPCSSILKFSIAVRYCSSWLLLPVTECKLLRLISYKSVYSILPPATAITGSHISHWCSNGSKFMTLQTTQIIWGLSSLTSYNSSECASNKTKFVKWQIKMELILYPGQTCPVFIYFIGYVNFSMLCSFHSLGKFSTLCKFYRGALTAWDLFPLDDFGRQMCRGKECLFNGVTSYCSLE